MQVGCHRSWVVSSTSNPTLPPEGVFIYTGITRTRNFCRFCRTFTPVLGTSVRSVRPSQNTRNFWKFYKAFIPVPEHQLVLLDIHTRTRNFSEFCTPRATIPGVRVQHLVYPAGTSQYPGYGYNTCYTRPALLRILYARATKPGISASYVTFSYLRPKRLEIL